jgi:hypothetical protein
MKEAKQIATDGKPMMAVGLETTEDEDEEDI